MHKVLFQQYFFSRRDKTGQNCYLDYWISFFRTVVCLWFPSIFNLEKWYNPEKLVTFSWRIRRMTYWFIPREIHSLADMLDSNLPQLHTWEYLIRTGYKNNFVAKSIEKKIKTKLLLIIIDKEKMYKYNSIDLYI